jgi:hypothetical protein
MEEWISDLASSSRALVLVLLLSYIALKVFLPAVHFFLDGGKHTAI